MYSKTLGLFLTAALFTANVLAQEVPVKKEAPTKKEIRAQKKAEAEANGAKADATLQKNDIYDKQVMENNQDMKTVQMHTGRMNKRFHKRKLMHRLRRRRH